MSDSVWPHRRQPNRLLCPWDFPGKNTRVGCHLQVKSPLNPHSASPAFRKVHVVCEFFLQPLYMRLTPLSLRTTWNPSVEFHFYFLFFSETVDLQCCVSFWCIEIDSVYIYIYMYIYPFSYSFPLWFIWVKFHAHTPLGNPYPSLYFQRDFLRILLFIYSFSWGLGQNLFSCKGDDLRVVVVFFFHSPCFYFREEAGQFCPSVTGLGYERA